jgi:hypothetical protein
LTSIRKHSSSTDPSALNGVTSAVAQPRSQSHFIVISHPKSYRFPVPIYAAPGTFIKPQRADLQNCGCNDSYDFYETA